MNTNGVQNDGNTSANVVTQPTNQNEGAFKVFQTEQDYQNAVNSILKSKLPPEDEMKSFKEWKENQKTQEQKQTELKEKYDSVVAENTSLKQLNEIYSKGINDKDEVEFIQFKLSKMEGEFGSNLDNYLKNKPPKREEPKTTGFSQNNTNKMVSEEKAYLDKKYANNPYYKK